MFFSGVNAPEQTGFNFGVDVWERTCFDTGIDGDGRIVYDSIGQSLILLSTLPLARIFLSGLYARALTQSEYPVRTFINPPVDVFHSLITWSRPGLARVLLFGLYTIQFIELECPSIVRIPSTVFAWTAGCSVSLSSPNISTPSFVEQLHQ